MMSSSKDRAARKFQFLSLMAQDPELNGVANRIGTLLIVDYWNKQTDMAWPSIRTLAARLQCSVNGIKAAIKKLESRGFFIVHRGGGGARSNRFIPNWTIVDTPTASATVTVLASPGHGSEPGGQRECTRRASGVDQGGNGSGPEPSDEPVYVNPFRERIASSGDEVLSLKSLCCTMEQTFKDLKNLYPKDLLNQTAWGLLLEDANALQQKIAGAPDDREIAGHFDRVVGDILSFEEATLARQLTGAQDARNQRGRERY